MARTKSRSLFRRKLKFKGILVPFGHFIPGMGHVLLTQIRHHLRFKASVYATVALIISLCVGFHSLIAPVGNPFAMFAQWCIESPMDEDCSSFAMADFSNLLRRCRTRNNHANINRNRSVGWNWEAVFHLFCVFNESNRKQVDIHC
jgi:hypothetical protein